MYFKDTENKLHWLDDAKYIDLLPEGSSEITDLEAEVLRQAPPETPEQIVARLESAVDRYLNEQAKSLRYESIKTIVSYRDDPNQKFKAEGIAGYQLRSQVYTLSLQLIEDVTKGLKEVPTEAELIASLPKITDFLQYE